MKLYNQIAGGNIERVGTLSDGVIAFAMTILVLDLREPFAKLIAQTPHTDAALLATLANLGLPFATFMMAFMTLGIFWVGQQAQLDSMTRSDRNLTWIYMAFLVAVTLVPLTTWLLIHTLVRTSLLIYWLNLLLLGSLLFASLSYARHAGLLKDEREADYRALVNRIIYAQSLYTVCAALCFISIPLSIGCLLTVQLIYAIAPRIRLLYKM